MMPRLRVIPDDPESLPSFVRIVRPLAFLRDRGPGKRFHPSRCDGLKPRMTFRLADSIAGRIRRREGTTAVAPYWCQVCKGYHVGRPPDEP